MVGRRRFGLIIFALLSALLISGCSGQLPRVIPARETSAAAEPAATLATPADSPDAGLLSLPSAFRFQVGLRPAGQSEAPFTLISGEYRNGEWRQLSGAAQRDFDIPDQELIVAHGDADGALRSYTRAVTETLWTRWPGVTFDGAYGLSSPFTLLRLRHLATGTATPEDQMSTAGPADTRKVQAFFSAETVQRLLMAGAAEVATDAESRASLGEQIAAQFAPQTLYYWADADGRVRQVVGTLLMLGPDGQPAPWLEVSAIFSDYDDAAITVTAPAEAADIGAVAGGPTSSEGNPQLEAAPVAGLTLRVRVFATPGQPATDAIVTVYPKGKKNVVAEQLGADAQFKLKPGQYDVLARAAGAEQWLRDVAVTDGAVTSNDVLFDFAPLIVTVTLGGTAPAVDVVVYPAGERVRFAGFATANPARFLLPAGLYDVEVGAIDGSARKRVDGVAVRSGLETTQTIDLDQP